MNGRIIRDHCSNAAVEREKQKKDCDHSSTCVYMRWGSCGGKESENHFELAPRRSELNAFIIKCIFLAPTVVEE